MMSATIAPVLSPILTPQPHLLTAADLAALPDELPSGPARYELDDGRLLVMPAPGDTHSAVSSNITAHLKVHGEWAGHGKARDAVSVILRRGPDRVVGTDACFIANASLPLKLSPEGFLETIPDLVVEVRSKNDTMAELERKAGEYLAAGTKLVWVIDPLRSVAVIYQGGHPPRTLTPADDLTADGIIPGFRLNVGEALRV
jgi:Uma2 family endonuclease